jgi:8-oxo-dGTP diphosphatase
MGGVEEPLVGGNVGGAVRVADTVRRATGPWTPAVHALLDHVAARVPHVPRVLGFDERGREILTYLPGTVLDDGDVPTDGQLGSMVRWTRTFHDAVTGFTHPGPWRYFPIPDATMIGHNDIAQYNICFDGDDVVGVFDWDMCGPTTPLYELAFLAWNGVPLWRDISSQRAADRLTLIAGTYGGPTARDVLHAVPPRIQIMLEGIPVAAAAGDLGMLNLLTVGEPERSRVALAGLIDRLAGIADLLS